MANVAVIIPAPGYWGDSCITCAYDPSAERDRRWDVLVGEGLAPGREIKKGELSTMLATGAWYIRTKRA